MEWLDKKRYGKGRPKFSMEQKEEIVKEYFEKEETTMEELAVKYETTPTSISNWVKLIKEKYNEQQC